MTNFRFIEHTADIAAEVTATNLEDLFTFAAEAWLISVLENGTSEEKETKKINITAESLEELLVNFLNELNYLLLTKRWICSSTKKIEIRSKENNINVYAEIKGANFDDTKHVLKEEIKAVTYHQMKIQREGNKFRTRIVFDI